MIRAYICNNSLRFLPLVLLILLSISIHLPTLNAEKDVRAEINSLQLVQIIVRHGARAPNRPFPNDAYKNMSLYWPNGWRQLTRIGIQQQQELGSYIRIRYDGFIPIRYSSYDFYCESSDADRAIQSAQANLDRFYPPVEHDTLRQWQPIPIHTVPSQLDNFLSVDQQCPRLQSLITELYQNDSSIIQFNNENKDFIEYLRDKSGNNQSSPAGTLEQLFDVFSAEKAQNYTVPNWVTDDVFLKLESYKAHSFQWLTSTDDLKRLLVGPLLNKLLTNFHVRASFRKPIEAQDVPFENEEPFRKMKLYSAHDETIGYLLNTWKIFNGLVPPFSSALFIELHRSSADPESRVEVYYKNESNSKDPPYLLKLAFCGEPCYLSTLEKLSKPYIPMDWSKECQILSSVEGLSEGLTNVKTGETNHFASIMLGLITVGVIATAVYNFTKTKILLNSKRLFTYETLQ